MTSHLEKISIVKLKLSQIYIEKLDQSKVK